MSATRAASSTQARKASSSQITWSAAKEPSSASGSSRSSRRPPSRSAAIESRGDGSARTRSTRGQLPAYGALVGRAGHHHDAAAHQRAQPVDRALQQGAARPGQVEQELGVRGSRERPQPGAGSPGRDHGPEAVEHGPVGAGGGGHGAESGTRRTSVSTVNAVPGGPWAHRTRARTFPALLAPAAARGPRPAAGDVLRRRDRRAHRAVGRDVRQLGVEERQPAARGARRRAGRRGAARPAHPLAGAGVRGRGVVGRRRGHDRRDGRPPGGRVRPRRPRLAGTARDRRDVQVLACSLHPFATRFPQPLPRACWTTGPPGPGRATCSCPRSPSTRTASPSSGHRSASGARHAGGPARRGPGSTARRRRPAAHRPAPRRARVTDLLAPFAQGGSVVLVRHGDPASWAGRADAGACRRRTPQRRPRRDRRGW